MGSEKRDPAATGDIEQGGVDDIRPAATPFEEDPVHDAKWAEENRHVGTLNRNLKSRHIQFLALAGAIGTGLFVGSGQVLSLAGPLSAFISYIVTGFNLFCVINCLGRVLLQGDTRKVRLTKAHAGEMTAYLPVPGSFESLGYSTRHSG